MISSENRHRFFNHFQRISPKGRPLSADLWSIILSYSRGREAKYLVENVVPKEKVYEWWDEIKTGEELKWVSQFRNLRYLDMWLFTGNDLSTLQGMPLQELWLNNFTGRDSGGWIIKDVLSPLKGMPLQTLYLDNFTGRDARGWIIKDVLSPLQGMPLQTLYIWRFTGDLSPLQEMKIENYGKMI